ncbi:DUF2842 domain-containing protein, partial [Phenylobacterium sp.]|uniref:DUF2842 domain-containing protein n=1 Tax=Phenylobacterium sp. TaxID=1871053 RepID=UPI00398391B7
MPMRLRKFLGLIAILVFLAAYVVLVIAVGEYVPAHWAASLAYYGIAGTAWGLPL